MVGTLKGHKEQSNGQLASESTHSVPAYREFAYPAGNGLLEASTQMSQAAVKSLQHLQC